jgi:DNA ligase (NAD+)
MRELEGMGEKSVSNLRDAIERSKAQPLHRLIYALGIRYVGETTAKALAARTGHLLDLASKSAEELQQIEDVGVKVAESISQFFSNGDNIRMLKTLEELGLEMSGKKTEPVSGNLEGKSFLFTGTLLKLKRSEAEEIVERNGGRLVSGVSSKLDYLVVGEDAGSKLEKAKKINTIHIIDEDGFLKMTGWDQHSVEKEL